MKTNSDNNNLSCSRNTSTHVCNYLRMTFDNYINWRDSNKGCNTSLRGAETEVTPKLVAYKSLYRVLDTQQ